MSQRLRVGALKNEFLFDMKNSSKFPQIGKIPHSVVLSTEINKITIYFSKNIFIKSCVVSVKE